jgi:CheY-like chemotaxis protein
MGTEQIGSNALGEFFSHGGLAGGGALLLALGLVYAFRKLLHGRESNSVDRPVSLPPAGGKDTEIVAALSDDRLVQWYADQDRVALSEAASSFAWGLSIFGFISGASTFIYVVSEHLRSGVFGLSWIAILAAFIAFFLTTLRQKTIRSASLFAAYTAAVSLLWPGLLVAVTPHLAVQALSLLAVIYFAYSTLPISGRYHIIISLVASMVLLLGLDQIPLWPVVGLIALLLIFISTRNAISAYIDLCWRISALQLARFGEGIRPGVILRLLARQLQLTLDAPEVLIVCESGSGVLTSAGRDVGRIVDPVVVRSLLSKLDQLGQEDGRVKTRDLGQQYLGPIVDWFGQLPYFIHFVKISAVLDEREERVLLLTPRFLGLSMIGQGRLAKAIGSTAGMARAIMSIGRHRILSSDAYVSSARSVSERELELDRLIHSVNNSSQDIAIQCDEIRQNIEKIAAPDKEKPIIDKVLIGIKQLETLSRMVSAGVSDVKLLRELQKLKEMARIEQVKLIGVIDELETFCHFRGWRKGFESKVVQVGCEGFAAKVAGREFLEMGLRLLVKTLGNRLEPNGKINIEVECDGATAKFKCSDTGPEFDALIKSRVVDPNILGTVGIAQVDALRAVNKFANLSGGNFSFSPPEPGFNNCVVLSLITVPAAEVRAPISGQWVLLVDDSLEVTTFYGRVAEAMQLKYFTATSLADARKILSDQGRPRLVITDVQLGDGSGVDLVRALRSKYGAELPVIVVSGESDSEVVERIRSAGATKYLTKPVGRKKLFEEIEMIMGGGS